MVEKLHISFCERCGAEIVDEGFMVDQKIYCCKICSDGLACDCSERIFLEAERRSQHAVPSYTTYGE